MAKGLRFFGTDFNNQQLGGTITVSSADNTKTFAFDGLIGTRWISDGEDTDGNAVSIEMDYGFNRTIDSFYVYNTNIDDIVLQYDDGGYVNITSSNATIIKDSTGAFVFVKMNSSITTQKVKITGSDTIIADSEKFVALFFAFEQIGQFEYFPGFKPLVDPFQSVFKTTDGRSFVIERGEAFKCKVQFKSHTNTNDIALAETLLARKEPFYLWANGGDD